MVPEANSPNHESPSRQILTRIHLSLCDNISQDVHAKQREAAARRREARDGYLLWMGDQID